MRGMFGCLPFCLNVCHYVYVRSFEFGEENKPLNSRQKCRNQNIEIHSKCIQNKCGALFLLN